MKLMELLTLKRKKPFLKDEQSSFHVELNDEELTNITVLSTSTHRATLNMLRNLKTPQYDSWFVLRRKKGFNTYLFEMSYDVIITDNAGRVVETLIDIKPGYISSYYDDSFYIYFTTVGTIKFYEIEKENIIRIHKNWFKK